MPSRPDVLGLLAEFNQLAAVARSRGMNVPHRNSRMQSRELVVRIQRLRSRLNSSTNMTEAPIIATGDFSFGVEIECLLPAGISHARAAELVAEAGVSCRYEMYNHSARSGWKIVTDGSLSGGYARGAEFVSPPLSGEEGFAQLRKVCEVLTAHNFKIDRSCGFHVHIGARNEQIGFFKSLVRSYRHFEVAFDAMMPASRRGSANNFCGPVRLDVARLDAAVTVEDVARATFQDYTADRARSYNRYRKFNLQSYWQHGTVEFRHHSGTVEARKSEMWVKMCMAMCSAARRNVAAAEYTADLNGLLGFAQVSVEDAAYFRARVENVQRNETRRRAA